MDIPAIKEDATPGFNRGYLICISATVLWSFTAILIRHLTEVYRLPSLVLAFWRDLFVAIALIAAFSLLSRSRLSVDRRHIPFLLAYGLVLAAFNTLWTVSVSLNGAAVSTVLAYSSTAFTALLGWRLLAERLTPLKVFIVTLTMLGCVLVSGAFDPATWRLNPVGILAGLLSGLGFAIYSLMGRVSSRRGIDPGSALLYAFGFAALFLFCYSIYPGAIPGEPRADLFWLGGAFAGWGVLVLLAVGPTIGGFGLYTLSLVYLPASVANLIATLEPVLTAGLAYLLLSERFSTPQLLGSSLILVSVVVLRLSESRVWSTR